jgi:hypothetical protein
MVCNYMRIVILQCKSCDPVLVLFCNYLGASDSFWGGFVGSKERQDGGPFLSDVINVSHS